MSRKYRQPGYQDSDRNDERSRPPKAPPQQGPHRALGDEQRFQLRSMRHAMDRQAHEVLRCHSCGRSSGEIGIVGHDDICPHCAAALHCCRNCRHFDTSAHWQCRTTIPAHVADKVGSNTCAQFEPRLVLDATGRRAAGSAPGKASGDARSQFENLFKR